MTSRNGLLSTLALLLVGALVGAVVAGCGIRPSGVIHGQDAPRGAVNSLIVYLIDHNSLRAVTRPLPATPTSPGVYVSGGQQALDALLQGPTASEAAGGLTSDIPPNSYASMPRLIESYTIMVFVKSNPDGPLTQHAVDQIACTLIAAMGADSYDQTNQFQVQVLDGAKQWPRQRCPLPTP